MDDAGYEFALGDKLNGFICKESFDADDFESGIDWLSKKIVEHYPYSRYANKINEQV